METTYSQLFYLGSIIFVCGAMIFGIVQYLKLSKFEKEEKEKSEYLQERYNDIVEIVENVLKNYLYNYCSTIDVDQLSAEECFSKYYNYDYLEDFHNYIVLAERSNVCGKLDKFTISHILTVSILLNPISSKSLPDIEDTELFNFDFACSCGQAYLSQYIIMQTK